MSGFPTSPVMTTGLGKSSRFDHFLTISFGRYLPQTGSLALDGSANAGR